jgi:hypothetical protein
VFHLEFKLGNLVSEIRHLQSQVLILYSKLLNLGILRGNKSFKVHDFSLLLLDDHSLLLDSLILLLDLLFLLHDLLFLLLDLL